MDRQQREAELREMLTTQRGKEELLAVLKEHAGLEGKGNLPPFGTLLVDAILNYEYPSDVAGGPGGEAATGRDAGQPARESMEPGDVKFDEPPGREAPGG
ncbi:MAG: hypothetical protein U0790_27500 [Isosphaeraceae bacterium]